MKKLRFLLFPLSVCLSAPAASMEYARTGLCTGTEKVLFYCPAGKGKVISLCASSDLAKGRGSLTYRFGEPGKKPELEYPRAGVAPEKAFTFSQYRYIKGGGVQVAFSVDTVTYTIYTDWHSFGDSGPGFMVHKKNKRIRWIGECPEPGFKKGAENDTLDSLEALGLPEPPELPFWPERKSNIPPDLPLDSEGY